MEKFSFWESPSEIIVDYRLSRPKCCHPVLYCNMVVIMLGAAAQTVQDDKRRRAYSQLASIDLCLWLGCLQFTRRPSTCSPYCLSTHHATYYRLGVTTSTHVYDIAIELCSYWADGLYDVFRHKADQVCLHMIIGRPYRL